MIKPFVPRAPVLPKSRSVGEAPRHLPPAGAAPARSFQVLQSSRAPSQLCLFLRHGAADVK
ncbi:MAG TPA: hypothetical protein VF169_22900 [Albitalea sp.]|uniref:hypothetical protein n=1 Tax=Piscinibacter sp. TaxID=1903157 RepID=UPI002ED2FBC6